MAVSATVPNAEDVVEWLAGPKEDGVHYKGPFTNDVS